MLRWLKRLHPVLYLSGGVWGAALNWFCTQWFIANLQFRLESAFIFGLLLNCAFNFWFTLTVLRERSHHKRFEFFIGSYCAICAALIVLGYAAIVLLHRALNLPVDWALPLAIAALSLLSLFAGRIWIFVSPDAALVEYQNLSGEYYQDSTDADKVGGFRAWYHAGRFHETERLVREFHRKGQAIYDLGCGGSEWNRAGLPVIGVDVNQYMLESGKQRGQLQDYHVAPLEQTGLLGESTDLVVLTEVLEHMENPELVLQEIRRILKPDGHLILSVPWDHVLSPFFWLFNANCFYRGYLLGEGYHRQRCGHVNHFTRLRLKRLLRKCGFDLIQMNVFRYLLIYAVCKKSRNYNS